VGMRGGLGNQMFQFALGCAVARRHDRCLVLDRSSLEVNPPGTTPRTYQLDAFDLRVPVVDRTHVESVGALCVVVERKPGFYPEVLASLPFDHVYLQGFWQDHRYFADAESTVRGAYISALQNARAPDARYAIVSEPEPVCVHVRRQDYLGPAGAHMGFVGESYYRDAIALMANRVPWAHYFVFSDDLPWCEQNLGVPYPHTFVRPASPDAATPIAALALMSSCRHFIIANSSFSWWAAWMAKNPDKIVVAPKRWFSGASSHNPALADWARV
jgi:hypothetical protein